MMNRILNHHSGGGYKPSAEDRRAYHVLIDGDGAQHAGNHPIEANAPGRRLQPGKYAPHTLNLNGGAIGNVVCAMGGGLWGDPFACDNFPRLGQWEALAALNARQCVDHGIAVTRATVLSHAEVEVTLRVKQRGKWDFDYDPTRESSTRDPVAIGDAFRNRVRAIIETLGQGAEAIAAPPAARPELRRGATGDLVEEMQRALIRHGATIVADKVFGPKTWAAVVAFQKRKQLLPDGVCARMTWAALLAAK